MGERHDSRRHATNLGVHPVDSRHLFVPVRCDGKGSGMSEHYSEVGPNLSQLMEDGATANTCSIRRILVIGLCGD